MGEEFMLFFGLGKFFESNFGNIPKVLLLQQRHNNYKSCY